MKKLPVFASLGEVLSGVTRHYFELLFSAWPAILILLAASAITVWQYYSVGYFDAIAAFDDPNAMERLKAIDTELHTGMNGVVFAFVTLLSVLASAVAAVRWHRLVLLGEGTSGHRDEVRPIRSEDGTYIWTSIKLFLFFAGVILAAAIVVAVIVALVGKSAIAPIVSPLVAILTIVGVVWFLTYGMRMSLALPDAALGGGGRLFAMVEASKGNGWRLFGLVLLLAIVMIAMFVVLVLALGLSYKLFSALGGFGILLMVVIGVLAYIGAYLYWLMTQITMLSVAYREIIGLPGDAGLTDSREPL